MYDKGFIGGSVYLGPEGFKELNVYVSGERIAAVTEAELPAREIEDCRGLQLLPGLIDPHVHFSLDLGTYKTSDDFDLGTRQAAAGGITTVLDFLDPVGSTEDLAAALEARRALAARQSPYVDYGFHATLGDFKGAVAALPDALKTLGLFGVKVFTTYRESGRMIDLDQLALLLDQPLLTLVHAEMDTWVMPAWSRIATYGESRPLVSELEMLQWLAAHRGRGDLYVVHVSSGSGVAILDAARREGMQREGVGAWREGVGALWIESCPHYFYLDEDLFANTEGALYLIAPPLRSRQELLALRRRFGAVDTIGTDHCAFDHDLKLASQHAGTAPKGIGGIGHSFLLMYHLYGHHAIERMSSRVAAIFGLTQKGRIAPGMDADLVLFDPLGQTPLLAPVGVAHQDIYQRMPEDRIPQAFKGAILGTMLRGAWVHRRGAWQAPRGQWLKWAPPEEEAHNGRGGSKQTKGVGQSSALRL